MPSQKPKHHKLGLHINIYSHFILLSPTFHGNHMLPVSKICPDSFEQSYQKVIMDIYSWWLLQLIKLSEHKNHYNSISSAATELIFGVVVFESHSIHRPWGLKDHTKSWFKSSVILQYSSWCVFLSRMAISCFF